MNIYVVLFHPILNTAILFENISFIWVKFVCVRVKNWGVKSDKLLAEINIWTNHGFLRNEYKNFFALCYNHFYDFSPHHTIIYVLILTKTSKRLQCIKYLIQYKKNIVMCTKYHIRNLKINFYITVNSRKEHFPFTLN